MNSPVVGWRDSCPYAHQSDFSQEECANVLEEVEDGYLRTQNSGPVWFTLLM